MDNHQPSRWEVYDRYGHKIYMTAERWQHATESRPWLAEYHARSLDDITPGVSQTGPAEALEI